MFSQNSRRFQGLAAGMVLALGAELAHGDFSFNGDLYAYLVGPDATTRIDLLARNSDLLWSWDNQAGSGLQITLSDTASQSYQSAAQSNGALFTGTYRPVVSFGTFTGSAAKGTWRLYIEDESGGGGTSTLNSWSVAITTAAVPEPDQVAAMGLLGFMGVVAVVRGMARNGKQKTGKLRLGT